MTNSTSTSIFGGCTNVSVAVGRSSPRPCSGTSSGAVENELSTNSGASSSPSFTGAYVTSRRTWSPGARVCRPPPASRMNSSLLALVPMAAE